MSCWPTTYGRFVFQEVGSTLDEGVSLAAREPVPFWILAHQQTAARGRRARKWCMPSGNFAATLMLRPDEPPAQSALRSFVMSLALFRSFVEVTGRETSFALKWPNDVLLNGGKVAGILLESGGQTGTLAIGVGVNLVAAPGISEVEEGAVVPVSLAAETSVQVTPEDFLWVLADHYAQLETQFQDYGFAPVRRGWLAHAARLGQQITARTGRETLTGIFEDVDADGHLMLREPRGLTRIAAADVFF